MNYIPIEIRPGYFAPRPGNEYRAERRRALTARLRGPHRYIAPPTTFRGKPMTHSREMARRSKRAAA